jgi:DNA helicase HerA-like ATPase
VPADPTFLGVIGDVNGATVSVSLSSDTLSGLAFINGIGYRIGQIGSFVRIPIGFTDLFGVVSHVGAGAIPSKLAESYASSVRWMTVQLLGEGQRGDNFRRGISQYPTVGDQVHLVTDEDLARIYGTADSPNFVRVGNLSSAESIPALLDLNKLVSRHGAVLGATGAGKSTTVASLLRSFSDTTVYPSSRVLLIDVHGEYAPALKDRATIFRINPNEKLGHKPLYIPYWAMSFDELLSFTLGPLDDTARGAVLEKVTALKAESLAITPRAGITNDNLTVDAPVPFSINQLWFDFHCDMNSTHTAPGSGQSRKTQAFLEDQNGVPVEIGDALRVIPPKYKPQVPAQIYLSSSILNFRRPLQALATKLRDPRFAFLFRPGDWFPDLKGQPKLDLDALLEQWLSGPCPISILDLSGVPVTILNDLIGVLLRIIYDALFWSRFVSEGGRERPLLVVLEEAHAYLGKNDSSPASSAVRRIVKEGRKYGIGALIVSQRPSEIDTTILSQCGTLFAMRLSNSADRAHVTSTVTDNLEGLLAMLPALRTGEAIILGEAVQLPVRTQLELPGANMRPDSADPLVYDTTGPGGWNRSKEPTNYKEVVAMWRKQDSKSPSIKE